MIERVMLLDAVLDDRDFTWLGPSMDKRRHLIRHLGDRLEARDYPHLLFGKGVEKTARLDGACAQTAVLALTRWPAVR